MPVNKNVKRPHLHSSERVNKPISSTTHNVTNIFEFTIWKDQIVWPGLQPAPPVYCAPDDSADHNGD